MLTLSACVLVACAATSHTARLADAKVHYESYGEGDEALVFVHGWTCNGRFWRLQLKSFAERRVLVVDLPGHGDSDKPEQRYSMELFARGVDAVMTDAGVSKAVLVGHSMGAPVIRQFYRLFPERVLALVIVDGALRPFGDKASSDRMITSLKTGDFGKNLSGMLDSMLAPMKDAKLKDEVRKDMLSTPRHVALSAFENLLDPANFDADPIDVPLLAVLARSGSWPPDTETFLKSLAPGLELHMLDGVSHFLMLDAPNEFNAMLKAFLDHNDLLAD
ncbi:MAG: alpha/beta hydrolase [Planctomycetota bacterium]